MGIGSTALYHYFESKLHCLYEIMAEALEAELERFERITAEHEDFAAALDGVLASAFELSEHEVLRNRLLVSEQVLVGVHRTSAREEEARQLARARTRDLEFEVGGVPDARDGAGRDPRGRSAAAGARDPRSLQQRLPLVPAARRARRSQAVADFYVPRCLAVAGLAPVGRDGARPATQRPRPPLRRRPRSR